MRDRNQPSLVIRDTALTRFSDYDIDALTGRLLLHAPVPSFDPDLNPEGPETVMARDVPEMFERCGALISARRENPTATAALRCVSYIHSVLCSVTASGLYSALRHDALLLRRSESNFPSCFQYQ